MVKKYNNTEEQYPKRIDFVDGSAIIDCGSGGFIIVEAQTHYGYSNMFYWVNGIQFSLS